MVTIRLSPGGGALLNVAHLMGEAKTFARHDPLPRSPLDRGASPSRLGGAPTKR